jgi:hypothetical protein
MPFVQLPVSTTKVCCGALKTDQPCALKIDQGWRPREQALGTFAV